MRTVTLDFPVGFVKIALAIKKHDSTAKTCVSNFKKISLVWGQAYSLNKIRSRFLPESVRNKHSLGNKKYRLKLYITNTQKILNRFYEVIFLNFTYWTSGTRRDRETQLNGATSSISRLEIAMRLQILRLGITRFSLAS